LTYKASTSIVYYHLPLKFTSTIIMISHQRDTTSTMNIIFTMLINLYIYYIMFLHYQHHAYRFLFRQHTMNPPSYLLFMILTILYHIDIYYSIHIYQYQCHILFIVYDQDSYIPYYNFYFVVVLESRSLVTCPPWATAWSMASSSLLHQWPPTVA